VCQPAPYSTVRCCGQRACACLARAKPRRSPSEHPSYPSHLGGHVRIHMHDSAEERRCVHLHRPSLAEGSIFRRRPSRWWASSTAGSHRTTTGQCATTLASGSCSCPTAPMAAPQYSTSEQNHRRQHLSKPCHQARRLCAGASECLRTPAAHKWHQTLWLDWPAPAGRRSRRGLRQHMGSGWSASLPGSSGRPRTPTRCCPSVRFESHPKSAADVVAACPAHNICM
jgi:hypothetical protein